MTKQEGCQQYKKECISCPNSRLIYTNDQFETYIMCKYELQTIRDNIDRVLKSINKREQR